MSRVLSKNNQVSQAYKSGTHNGIDLVGEGSSLANILAHSDGTVEYVQTGYSNDTSSTGDDTYGNMIRIKHDGDYRTVYAHLASVDVAKGDTVTKGQKIGYMGNTGRSYGSHLHFEVRTSSAYSSIIDPTNYIDGDLPSSSSTVSGKASLINGYVKGDVVKEWQTIMNSVYKAGLDVDGSFGSLSQAAATKNYLSYKSGSVTKNNYVKWVQEQLNESGASLDVDSSFGPATQTAVKSFQKVQGLTQDGYVGADTVSKLFLN